MPIILDNCIEENRPGNPHKFITDCCCVINCNLINNDDFRVTIDNLFFSSTDFVVSNIFVDGNPIFFPFNLEAFQTATLDFTICAPSTELVETISLIIQSSINASNPTTTTFVYSCESILLSSFISPTSLNFGNVAVGNGSSLYINIPDKLLCCNDFFASELNPPFSNNGSVRVCPGDGSQQIAVFFSPTQLGSATENLGVSINECNFILIPISGNGIEAPSGTATSQKNKVDQTTRVEACSPRTVNNRCNTARTIQNAIKTNARRFGKR